MSSLDSDFPVYPLQQLKPCCENPMITETDDGNTEQDCENCGWSWHADRDPVIVFKSKGLYD